jgi:hypothetical protein
MKIFQEGSLMKRIFFVLIIAVSAIGVVSAQNWGNNWGPSQSVTVTGTLQLQNGAIALASNNSVYFVPTLQQYVGFVEGLKEGAGISVTGYVSGNVLQASQFTINGKSYNLLAQGFGTVPVPPAGYGYGGYGCCHYGYNSGWGRRW